MTTPIIRALRPLSAGFPQGRTFLPHKPETHPSTGNAIATRTNLTFPEPSLTGRTSGIRSTTTQQTPAMTPMMRPLRGRDGIAARSCC